MAARLAPSARAAGAAVVAMAMLAITAAGCTCSSRRGGGDSGSPTTTAPTSSPAASSLSSSPSSPLSDASIDMKCPDELLFARRGGSDPDRYVAPDDAERATLARAIGRLSASPPTGADRSDAEALLGRIGFEVVDVQALPGAVVVRESGDRLRGGGAYLLRLGSSSRLVVQSPHTFYDEGTLSLGCELFARSSARAYFVETAHRYKAAEATEDGDHPADVAHHAGSFYQAATEGLFEAGAIGTVVQLHGFSMRKPGEVVVVSSGAKVPGDPLVDGAQQALAAVVKDGKVARFPADTLELGATTNAQGALARARGARFLHVEMEGRLRKELGMRPDYRGRFLLALAGALEAS